MGRFKSSTDRLPRADYGLTLGTPWSIPWPFDAPSQSL